MRWLVPLVLALGACGPIAYVNEVTRKASDSVEVARAAQADKYAPYYWTRATQYLHQAMVLAAHADFQGANRFGRLANEAAKQATIDAREAAKDPSKRPLEVKPDVAPAKGADEPDAEVPPAKDKAKGGGVAPAKESP